MKILVNTEVQAVSGGLSPMEEKILNSGGCIDDLGHE